MLIEKDIVNFFNYNKLNQKNLILKSISDKHDKFGCPTLVRFITKVLF